MELREIIKKEVDMQLYEAYKSEGIEPLIAYLLAGKVEDKDVNIKSFISPSLDDIPNPALLLNADIAVDRIATAIINQEVIFSVNDFDSDGQTSAAIFRESFVNHFQYPEDKIKILVGHRLEDGYGLTQNLTDQILSAEPRPSLIITADCGSSDEQQIKQLKEEGIDVIVTDHHEISESGIPESAYTIVNPLQSGCSYPDKRIAGCMVLWLTLSTVRLKLIAEQILPEDSPGMEVLLDYVALGTIADCVSLQSIVNRAVVKYGLFILNMMSRPCWMALYDLLAMDSDLTSETIGFQVAPRINARSRMTDPYAAYDFLVSQNIEEANRLLIQLDENNTTRKAITAEMVESSLKQIELFELRSDFKHSIIVYSKDFHPGCQGIVASRLTEKYGVPAIVLSPHQGDYTVFTGSARSIPDVHIKNILDNVKRRIPEAIIQYGGHSGAAGLKIHSDRMSDFRAAVDEEIKIALAGERINNSFIAEASLVNANALNKETYDQLQTLQPYGRTFDEPCFVDNFKISSCRVIGKENPVHLSFTLINSHNVSIRGVWFNALDKAGDTVLFKAGQNIRCAYTLGENHYQGETTLQLMIKMINVYYF